MPVQRPAVQQPAAEDLQVARQIADAVLYEGYVLFPYRASAAKNRFRWQWGVVIPQAQHARGQAEPAQAVCEVLVREQGASSAVAVTVRFLRLRHRQMVDALGTEVDRLEVDGAPIPTWDEGLEHEVIPPPSSPALADPVTHPFSLPGGREVQSHDGAGASVRTTEDLSGVVQITRDRLDDLVSKVTVTVTNTTDWGHRRAPRDVVLRHSLVGVHVMLQATGGATIASAIDPPDWAAPWSEVRRSRGLYPVLAGGHPLEDGDGQPRDGCLSLALPIILADFPQIAPESTGASYDATEVDELLALCVLGLSDAEKAEARATDPRAAELVDRTTSLPPAVMDSLHGTMRSRSDRSRSELLPEPEVHITPETAAALGVGEAPLDRIRVGGVEVVVGSRVLLRPRRRADAQDLFLDGRIGLVERLVATDDGQPYLAVTVEDDPAAEMHRWYGRFHYFSSEEIEPIAAAPEDATAARRT